VSTIGWAGAGVFAGVVVALTFAVRAHTLPLAVFAASAAKVGAGEVWLLLASALVVDRPVYVGVVAFGLLGFAALRICNARVFWLAAVAGHIGSTLAVYAIIGALRLTDPDAFTSALTKQDFGVSAMQGAWIGAIAATAWSWAGADPRARALVAAAVCVVGGVAWRLHPDPSILTTEHLFAFLIGCCVVSWPRLAAWARSVVGGAVAPPRRNATTAG
jgi:hypothetical protein